MHCNFCSTEGLSKSTNISLRPKEKTKAGHILPCFSGRWGAAFLCAPASPEEQSGEAPAPGLGLQEEGCAQSQDSAGHHRTGRKRVSTARTCPLPPRTIGQGTGHRTETPLPTVLRLPHTPRRWARTPHPPCPLRMV